MQPARLSFSDFYTSHRGAVTALLLRRSLRALWPPSSVSGQFVLGIGHCSPYLRVWRKEAYRCANLAPQRLNPTRYPAGRPGLSLLADEAKLPLPDLCCDRILLMHGLEFAENTRRLLRDVWRVLKDDGRLLVVVPNRGGLWARAETTPFGQGQPYSFRQLDSLLTEALFRVEHRDCALFMPPLNSRLLLRSAGLWEKAGRLVLPHAGGLTLCEAVKDAYAALPTPVSARRLIVTVKA